METVRLLVLSDDSNRRRRQRTSAPFGCVGAFAAVCTRPSRFTARFALVCFYPKLFHFAGTTSPVVCVCAYRFISLSGMQNSRLGTRPARHYQHALTAAATETERPIQRTRWELRNDTNSSLKNHKTPFQLQAARLPTATRSARK